MDVSKYNTTDACNVPKTMHLRDPYTKEILKDGDGNTLDFYIYGVHSDRARNAAKQKDRSNKDESERGAEFLAAVTHGWSENVEDKDGPIKVSYENAVKMYLSQDWIAHQVLQFCTNLRHYDPLR